MTIETGIGISATIAVVFVVLGTVMPYINALDVQTTQNNVEGLQDNLGQTPQNTVGFLEIGASILSMFFWTFGNVPFIIDLLVLLPLRILFGIGIYAALRGIS